MIKFFVYLWKTQNCCPNMNNSKNKRSLNLILSYVGVPGEVVRVMAEETPKVPSKQSASCVALRSALSAKTNGMGGSPLVLHLVMLSFLHGLSKTRTSQSVPSVKPQLRK